MRLFTAINFSVEIKKSLIDLIESLKKQGVTASFTSHENLHLTLAFIGETESKDIVIDSIEKLSVPQFEISLENHGNFRDILWIGIKSDELLPKCVNELKNNLISCGFEIKNQKFTPHVTLARRAVFRNKIDLNVPKTSMTVHKISLMKSERIHGHLNYSEIYAKSLTKINNNIHCLKHIPRSR